MTNDDTSATMLHFAHDGRPRCRGCAARPSSLASGRAPIWPVPAIHSDAYLACVIRAFNSPTHQLTNSPTHQLTNSLNGDRSLQRPVGVVDVIVEAAAARGVQVAAVTLLPRGEMAHLIQ